jgi:hypothetical protein
MNTSSNFSPLPTLVAVTNVDSFMAIVEEFGLAETRAAVRSRMSSRAFIELLNALEGMPVPSTELSQVSCAIDSIHPPPNFDLGVANLLLRPLQ